MKNVKVVIAPNSNNPVTVKLDNDYLIVKELDVIVLPSIEGSFEVREKIEKGKDVTYHLMPIS